jgi:hypothetical protein
LIIKGSPQVHVLNSWSPAGGAILDVVEILEGEVLLEDIDHWSMHLKVVPDP